MSKKQLRRVRNKAMRGILNPICGFMTQLADWSGEKLGKGMQIWLHSDNQALKILRPVTVIASVVILIAMTIGSYLELQVGVEYMYTTPLSEIIKDVKSYVITSSQFQQPILWEIAQLMIGLVIVFICLAGVCIICNRIQRRSFLNK